MGRTMNLQEQAQYYSTTVWVAGPGFSLLSHRKSWSRTRDQAKKKVLINSSVTEEDLDAGAPKLSDVSSESTNRHRGNTIQSTHNSSRLYTSFCEASNEEAPGTRTNVLCILN